MNMSDVMKLKNVQVSSRVTTMLAGTTVSEYTGKGDLADVIWILATQTPTWRFVASGGNLLSSERLRVEAFEVYQDDEKLGRIGVEFYRRDYHIAISSRVARTQLERGDTVYTKSVATAVARAKKLLLKRNVNDIIEEATDAARSLMNNIESRTAQSIRNAYEGTLHRHVRSFVFDKVLGDFKAYLRTLPSPDSVAMLEKVETYINLNQDANVVTDVVGQYRGGNSCLVIVEDGKYIVQSKDGNTTYHDAETLPEHLRGKLGLLKLSNEGQMVAGTGCRVTAKVFLIVL